MNSPHPDARRRARRWALPSATAAALALGSLALLPGSASAASGNLTYSCTYGTLVSGAQPTTVTIDTDAPATSPVGEPLSVLTTTALTVPDSVHSALSALGATSVQLLAVDPDGVTVTYDFAGTSTPVRTHPVFHFASWTFTGTSGGAYSINPGPKVPGTYLVHAGAIDLDLTVATSSGTTTYPVSCTVPTGKLVDQILVTDTTTTAVALSSSSATYGGTPAVATATVTRGGTPTSAWPALGGTVQFTDGSTVLGTAPVSASGTATYSLGALKSGQHSIKAAYVPATGEPYLASTSSASTLTVSSPTTTTVSAPDSVNVGATASATATVTAADGTAPTGSVTFTVDGTASAPVALSGSGTATFALPTGTPGSHTVAASYAGAGALLASSGSDTYGVGAQTTTEVDLGGVSTWTYPDAAPTVTATVTAPGSTSSWPAIQGSVQFKDGGTNLGGSVPLTDGTATLPQLGDLSLGDHAITASYLPANGSSYAPSSSSAKSLHVQTRTSTVMTVPASVGIDATGVTAIANVASVQPGTVPTGTVTFTIDGVAQAPVDLAADGSARSHDLPTGKAGTHTIEATYSGDGVHVTSDAHSATYIVGAAHTATALSVPASAAYGARTVVRATVSSTKGVPTGTVTFKIAGRSVAAPVRNGVASAVLPTIAAGAYQVSAAFSPADATAYQPSGVSGKWVRITRDGTRTTSSVRGLRLHQRPSASITVRSLHGAPVTGKVFVQLKRYGRVAQTRTVTLRNGKATVSFWKIGLPGRWAIAATYTGSANHTASAVAKAVVVKAKPATHTKAHKRH